ncbi:L,D-transpeptidase catalytic domain protein [Leptospira ognonensis]|uniref:L,D-transpeptidase catalytic domain protein n=1 Tax=Leptospira ognonensis TaxID=2484945 RepID=A0A4R9JYE7_9LEPT|nr:L,D-transpeptidase catalytic domain protein [Leptospira ognonensis]
MTVNHWVAGSSPAGGANTLSRNPLRNLFFVLLLFISHSTLLHSTSFPAETEQVLFVFPLENPSRGILKVFEVKDGFWRQAAADIPVSLGSAGILSQTDKREGDGGTPDGTYPLERSFGYREDPSYKISYRKLTRKDIWVDDPNSKYYNQFLPRKRGKIKGKSVFSNPEIYRLFLVIEHNTKTTIPGHGSMLFIHSWSDLEKPTFGCLGLKMEDLEWLMRWLDPEKLPTLMILREFQRSD